MIQIRKIKKKSNQEIISRNKEIIRRNKEIKSRHIERKVVIARYVCSFCLFVVFRPA